MGVVIANFTSYIDQNLPSGILYSISTPFDKSLPTLNTLFFEWKFMTIFSILFGYGFGLIRIGLEKKNINPNAFFTRRMWWLFVIGLIHTLFWWGDVLHFYAVYGLMLLPFKKVSVRTLLFCSLFLMFVVPPFVSLLFQDSPDYFTDQNMQLLYEHCKHGSMLDIFKCNINLYYKAFILTGGDLHDISETLGRFLFGYFLLGMKLFESIKTKKQFFKNVSIVTAPLMLVYLIIRRLSLQDIISTGTFYWEPLLKIGILSTSCFQCPFIVKDLSGFSR